MFSLLFFLGLTSSTKVAVKKTLLLREYGPKKLSFLFLQENRDGLQMAQLFVIWTHLVFCTHVSLKQVTSFPLSRC